MVKIINGEIVDDHDPRARHLIQAHEHFLLLQQHHQQQQQQQQHQQPPQQYYPYPPYGYYPQFGYPQPQQLPPEYQQYYQHQHQSPFAVYEPDNEQHATIPPTDALPAASSTTTPHLGLPNAVSTGHSPSLSHRRLSISNTAPAGVPSPSLSSRRLSFLSALPPQTNSLATPPAATRRLSLSSHSPHPLHPIPSSAPNHLSLAPPPPPATLYPRRHPSSYNLFGLPSITIAEIQVRPHVYLLAALLLYFIGPPVLVPLLASFFFYRWHLAREEQQKEKERLELKFSAFRYAKTRPRLDSSAGTRIHSLRDIQG